MNESVDRDFFKENFTSLKIDKISKPIQRDEKNFFMGSCFATNLYGFFQNHYIDSMISPFGNVYNPLSLANSLDLLCSSEKLKEKDIFHHKGLWRHFAFDGQNYNTDKKDFLNVINKKLEEGRAYLKITNNLYLTLGTSFSYKHIQNSSIVNNCHQLPGDKFKRQNISVDLMKMTLLRSIEKLKNINKNIQIFMSLSPVRHLRDNVTENSLSKARLRCLIDELSQEIPLVYFPAYEILLDQLRDYRWYKDDLCHPSEKAVEYIMDRFVESSCNEDFLKYIKSIKKLNNSLNHKIMHRESTESEKFEDDLKKRFTHTIDQYKDMRLLLKAFKKRYI